MITVEVKGHAGSGKSAIAQVIAALLREAGFAVNDAPEAAIRSEDELANVLTSLASRGTVVNIVESTRPHHG